MAIYTIKIPLKNIRKNFIQILLIGKNPIKKEHLIFVFQNFWYLSGSPSPISRPLMMVVLQNLTAIYIRATADGSATYAELDGLAMKVAVPAVNISSDIGDTAYGVEKCICPERYSGLSCQVN